MLEPDNINDNVSDNHTESEFQKGLPPGASSISHCKNLMQYIVHIKKNNKKYVALLDTGSGVSCIKADIASQFNQYKAPTQLRAKLSLAASSDANSSVDNIILDSFVNLDFKIGNFNTSYNFRVFPNMNADIILGLDWIIHNNPIVPDWSSGVLFLQHSTSSSFSKRRKFNKNIFKVKPLKSVQPTVVPTQPIKKVDVSSDKTTREQTKSVESGLISAVEVSKSTDWE
jgi:hypothetical protein